MDLVEAVVVEVAVVVVAAGVDRAGWAERSQPGLVGTVYAPRVAIGPNILWACPALTSSVRSVARRWCVRPRHSATQAG